MGYKWKPSASQRRAFAAKMQDPFEKAQYEANKEAKAAKRRESSQFDYNSAGGNYIPTQAQYHAAIEAIGTGIDNDCNMVIYGYTCQENVHHDHIHVINEFLRSKANDNI